MSFHVSRAQQAGIYASKLWGSGRSAVKQLPINHPPTGSCSGLAALLAGAGGHGLPGCPGCMVRWTRHPGQGQAGPWKRPRPACPCVGAQLLGAAVPRGWNGCLQLPACGVRCGVCAVPGGRPLAGGCHCSEGSGVSDSAAPGRGQPGPPQRVMVSSQGGWCCPTRQRGALVLCGGTGPCPGDGSLTCRHSSKCPAWVVSPVRTH